MEEIREIGAYKIAPVKNGERVIGYTITSFSGNFKLEVDETTTLGVVLGQAADGMNDIIHSWITTIYLLTQELPDVDFLEQFLNSYNGLQSRWKEILGEGEQEDEETAIQNVMMQEVGRDELEAVIDDATKGVKNIQEEFDKLKDGNNNGDKEHQDKG